MNFGANSIEKAATNCHIMPAIVLTAINARYSHTSLGMRYLYANLGALREQSHLFEFTLQDPPAAIAAAIMEQSPAVVAIGVYIWNRLAVESVVSLLQAKAPGLPIILGGPEIAHDTASTLADKVACVVSGEGEGVIEGICGAAQEGRQLPRVFTSTPPPLSKIQLPYVDYTDTDISHRTLYVETSRGCPSRCEYCISALDDQVRYFDLDRILPEFQRLLDRGARHFKFVDRSFNINPSHACKLLRFFAERWQEGMQLHLEMTPDRLPAPLREQLLAFPPGGLHIEAGVQTFNEVVAKRVSRPMKSQDVESGLHFLIHEAKADVHADLIAGLPGETPESFESGFNRLVAIGPSELQVGILKRLHGAPIARHMQEWGMVFREEPPYDILSTRDMDAVYLDGIARFSKHWDRVVNRHLLPTASPLIWEGHPSAFGAFNAFSLALESKLGRHSFGLVDLARELLHVLVNTRGITPAAARSAIRRDYADGGRRTGIPKFLTTEGPGELNTRSCARRAKASERSSLRC
ncbi:MAG: radical SAM protein [Verrucomicrobia bacterium]|jgi:radical SAM superfamily enzyme YgiQ (UPF0313 family)|nr:radical SAM protein [Verrucomicrobiota bacterium]